MIRFPHSLVLLLLLLFAGAGSPAPAGASEHRQVLVLHAYHAGFTWTDSIQAGVAAVLGGREDVELHVEYMDSKRVPPEAVFPPLLALYREKFRGLALDAVLTSDDNALTFALAHRAELFPGVPLVFCGVNNFSDARIAGHAGVTGVAEDVDFGATMELLLRLQPETRTVAVVSDVTPTGALHRERFEAEVEPTYADRVVFRHLYELTADELRAALAALPEHSAVFSLTFWRDPSGRAFNHRESSALLTSNPAVPVLTNWDHTVMGGVVGGAAVNGRLQGQTAAGMVARILDGTPVEAIPVVRESPNPPLFDYPALRHFGLGPDDLPAGSLVLHEPRSFLYRHRELVWAVVVFVLLQSAAIVALWLSRTRLRHARAALRASKARFRAIIEKSPQALAVNDAAGEVLLLNRKFVEIFGYTREDLPTLERWWPLAYPDPGYREEGREIWLREVARVAETGAAMEPLERRVRCRDGSEKVIEFRYSDLGDQGVTVFTDLTPRYREEEDRRAFEAQVQHAQKLESLGVLAGGIAHDFNNLLVGVLGSADLALSQLPPDSPARSHLERVGAAAQRAAELTQQLLAYSGKGRFVIAPTDVNALVEEMGHLLGTVISKKAELRRELAPDLPPVEADATQLRQVLMNLITNASDALGERSGVIAVSTAVTELAAEQVPTFSGAGELPPGRYLRLEVSDTGAGMDDVTRARIFDPFFTTKDRGRGLGLAAVQGILRGHGGAVRVRSAPGEGTAFTLLLPVAAREAAGGGAPVGEAAPERPGRGETVLVADDDGAVREVAELMLEQAGYRVVVVGDGRQAVEVFRSRHGEIAAVLLDLTMPVMGGDEAFREIRLIAPEVPVILSSGYSEEDSAARFVGQGLAGFIQKPYRYRALLDALGAALRGPGAGAAGESGGGPERPRGS